MVQVAGYYDESAEPADFGPIPSGEYEAEIIESSAEELKDNKGKCLVLVWKVISGEYAGRQVWQRLNLWFTGPEKTSGKVVQIANSQFAAVREATGVKVPADTTELHGIACTLRVDYIEQVGYKPKNEVSSVKPRGTFQPGFSPPAMPAASHGGPPSSGPAAAANGGTRPWGSGQRKTA